MKESLKCHTTWAVYYHPSRKSWYPPLEKIVYFYDIPQISPLPVVSMKDEHQQEMWEYARTYGRAVRQRTNRQENTMAKHRALHDYAYQRELADSSTYVRQDQSTSEENASATVERTSMEQEDLLVDEIEYDESTDEEGSASEKSDDENDSGNVMSNEIDKSATFLLGKITRYERAVRFSSRLLF